MCAFFCTTLDLQFLAMCPISPHGKHLMLAHLDAPFPPVSKSIHIQIFLIVHQILGVFIIQIDQSGLLLNSDLCYLSQSSKNSCHIRFTTCNN